MRLDALTRLVAAADFSSFREIALHILKARGFTPSLSDGPNDGGADFLLYQWGPQRAPLVVQISTEADWRSKIREDSAKVATMLKRDALLYLTTRRLPEVEFIAVADEVRTKHGVRVERMDGPAIASFAIAEHVVPEVLSALGIEPLPPSTISPFVPADHRRALAFACAFFGTDSDDFLRSVFDRAIVMELTLLGGNGERAIILARASNTLGLDEVRRSLLHGAIDRLIQRGIVHGPNGELTLNAAELARAQAGRAVQSKARDELLGQVQKTLAGLLPTHRLRQEAALAVLDNLGALVVAQTAESAQRAVFVEGNARPREQVRQLFATLTSFGIGDHDARELVPRVVTATQQSSFGRTLMAGQLFVSMAQLGTPHLLRVLGAGRPVHVLLDTSVAMPLLCAALYEPTSQRFFRAAQCVRQLLVAHGLPMSIPRDYLEEAASHLLNAWSQYGELVAHDPDPDLEASTNAFVSHFVALQRSGRLSVRSDPPRADFAAYLAGFGFDPALTRLAFADARNRLAARLQRLFGEYGVRVMDLAFDADALVRAEKAVDWAVRGLDEERQRKVLDHDARTLAWAFGREADAETGWVFCTWDRLHHRLRQEQQHEVDVIDPLALADLLALAAPGAQDRDDLVSSPELVALAFTEEVAQRGARVWDRLAAIEKEGFHDARLRAEARRFKEGWLGRRAQGESLPDAWRQWRGEHLP